jgi:hypothetical protein
MKISIIANKNWEAEPMLAALASSEFRPSTVPSPVVLMRNQDAKYRAKDNMTPSFAEDNIRAIFRFHQDGDLKKPVQLEVRVWCIQDFMDLDKSSSSSAEKLRFLPGLLSSENSDLVIAVGTAGYLSETSYNGCVVVGSRFFIRDAYETGANPDSDMSDKDFLKYKGEFGKLLSQNINPKAFGKIFPPNFKIQTEPKFLKVPNNPASRSTVLTSQYYTAIGTVNITDYGEYSWADKRSIEEYKQDGNLFPIGSLETTHGLIRLCSPSPTIFVSAITDREGNFDMEVTPAQNYTASFNAGIVVGQMIANISDLAKDANFNFRLK